VSKHFSHILIGLIFITILVSACQPQPTVADGTVYFGSLAGKLYAVAK
jgi:hypothetical protein